MRFLIIGAGALGGYYGGMLLKGGADVTFLVRPRRGAQLAERGLIVKNADGELVTGVRTVQAGDIGGPYDVVFLTCKAYDLDRAIDEFLPALAPNGAVLPVLNGINHIAVLQDRLGAGRVLGGVVIFLATMTPAGEIVVPGHGTGQTSFGELTGERSARCEAIQAALAAGGIASTVSENIVTELWGKFCGMAASSTIAVVTRSRAGAVAAAPAGAAFAAATFDECARVTTAEGYPPPANIREIVLGMWSQLGSDYGPSMLHDIENGRPNEGDHIIGDMVRRADRLGVTVPILRAALCNLQICEARRLQLEERTELPGPAARP
jgi:2-dehydropantoate 2-reductase